MSLMRLQNVNFIKSQRLLNTTIPLIQISDRGPEFSHAIKHKNIEIYEGGINDPKASHGDLEKEANKKNKDSGKNRSPYLIWIS